MWRGVSQRERDRGERVLGRGNSPWQSERSLEIEELKEKASVAGVQRANCVRRACKGGRALGALTRILVFILEKMGRF